MHTSGVPLSTAVACRSVSFIFLFLVFTALQAEANSAQPLNLTWEFRAVSKTADPEVSHWHAAQVPGVVHTDLLRNKLIPDPFYQDNEARLQWIGLTDWEYRTTLQVEPSVLGHEHVDLVFEGLDTFADVYLNEQAVLHADNMFRRWRVPVKASLKTGSNALRIVFHSPITSMIPKVKSMPYQLPSISTFNAGNEEGIATAPFTRKAPYQYGWDWGPRFVTMGIWKPVLLESWDELRLDDFHIHQERINQSVASLSAELEIEASRETTANIAVSYQDPSSNKKTMVKQSVQLDAGKNNVSLPFRIASPKLWYPVGYGAQNRYQFSVAIDIGKKTVATRELKTGLRSLELRRVPDEWGKSFTFVVNEIAVFAKGANIIPFDSFPDRVTPERHRQILQAARDAHMNMVRAWGGAYYESDDFYDICDELGIMVWQEFMFGGDMVPGDTPFQENVRQEAIDQVQRLRDHPSIVLWCGNNEIETGWMHWGDRQTFKDSIPGTARERVWQDYVVLFRDILKSVVAQYGDPTPYWPSSPGANFEAPPDNQTNGDMHYWSVWHALNPIEDYTKQAPRFMSEFGFQSFPEMRTILSFAKPEELDIRSTTMQAHQKNKGGNERILSYMLRWYPEPKDFASFVYLSQVLQAEAIKAGAEHFRRQRPRTMGSLYWQLNDCWPVASWASIDYYGRWKALHYYARRFYDDVIISPFRHDGAIDVYVVSDKLEPISARIQARLLDFGGKVLAEQTKDIQAPAQSSSVYLTLNEKDLLAKASPQRSFLVFDLLINGVRASRNLILFDTIRNLALPVAPRIESSISGAPGDYSLTLRSPGLARNVYLSFGEVDGQPSDNYFDLLPGEQTRIHLTTKAALEQVKNSLKITSLTDAFIAPKTTR
jgi:beta-mannosidase